MDEWNRPTPIIPVLRKVAQLNIKYRKKWGPIIDVCTGAPPVNFKKVKLDRTVNLSLLLFKH